jgi:MFS family permease
LSRYFPLASLATATLVSVGGTRLSAIAIPWLVLTTTESPVLTGLVGMAELLPYVFAKALAGPLIDKFGARRMAIVGDIASTVALLVVPLMFWAGLFSVWLLLPMVAVLGVMRAPADASKQALVPTLVTRDNLPVERVTGIMGAADRLAGTVGAAGAGLLIAAIGPIAALVCNAVAFALSAIIVSLGVPGDAKATPKNTVSSYRADLAAGWSTLRNDPVLRALVIMIAITNLFDQAYAVLLLPVWIRTNGLDVSWVGYILAAFSVSSILGAISAAAIGHRLWRLPIYVFGFLCAGPIAMFPFAMGLPVEVIIGILLVAGFGAGFLNPIVGAIMFESIPKGLVGRVISLIGAATMVLMPFGGLFAGLVVDNAGIAAALWICGSLYLIAALAPLAIPSFRRMNRNRGGDASEKATTETSSA